MSINKLNIEIKVDNPEKKRLNNALGIPKNETLAAEETNQIVLKTNEIIEKLNNVDQKVSLIVPITAFNFKENVATYADLPTVGNEVNDGYGVIADGLTYVYNGTSFPTEGNGMDLGLKPSGTVAEGVDLAVSGGEVYDYVKGELVLKADQADLVQLERDVEEISIKTSIVPITTEPYILSNTYFSHKNIHSLSGATLRYFKVFANVTYKIHIEGSNSTVAYGTTLELPAVGVAVQGVTVPTIPNLNGLEVTPENDCYIIIGNGSKATVTSCYIETVLYGVASLSVENKERLDSLNASQISQNSDNESNILIPLTSYSQAGTNNYKIGMYFENLVGKKITGIHLKAFESGTLKYGISTITNNIAGDFVEKGTISVTSGESDYLFLEPILLAENQCIYIQGKKLYGVYQFNNSISFIENFNNNSIIGTNFVFSYYLIVHNNLSAVIDNQEIRIQNLEVVKRLNYSALGDSITWGSFGGELPSEHGNSYADYLSDMLGVTSFKKLGRAGASIWLHFKSQIDSIAPNTNLITFNFGVNDATLITQNVNPIDMGDYKTVIEMVNDNPTDSVASTMYNHSVLGRFRWCVEYLKNKFPDATIVCLTLPDVNHTDPNRIATYIYLREAEEAISAYLGIPFVNLLNVSPVFNVPKWNGFINDFVHPLKYGYRMMAGAYYPFIKSLL